ncbi:MAG: flagellar basal-body MS-ring/collar protein FliF [Salinisphaeraceae bacterium]
MADLKHYTLQDVAAQPAVRQTLLLAGLAAAVAVGLFIFFWAQKPAFVTLYGGLGSEDVAAVTQSLDTAGISHRLSAAGTVSVPAGELHTARLKLAEQGLPSGSGSGFEMMAESQGFGVSQFMENARYQHALETELVRTISAMQPVKSARIHLATPKRTAFAREREAASASVFLDLHPGRSLTDNQIAAIANLVASGVTDMAADDVTVVDQRGRLLNGGKRDSRVAMSATQFDYLRRVEDSYADRVESLLTPVTGAGRVRAEVAVDMDFSVTERTSENFEPKPEAIRSEQILENSDNGGTNGIAGGIPGATSNQPPEAGAEARDAAGTRSVRRESTRNFELDRTISHTRNASGDIQRLSVAVLVDNVPRTNAQGVTESVPLTDAEITRLESLVRDAVGFNADRGDTVSVMNAAFVSPEITDMPAAPIWQSPALRDWGRQIMGGLLVLILLFAVLRPVLRQILSQPNFNAMRNVTPVEDELGDDRLTLSGPRAAAAAAVSDGPYEQQLMLARQAVSNDAKRVAQVVQTWVKQDG